MLTPLITFGGILFWIITAVLFLVAVVFSSNRHNGKSFLAVLFYVSILVLFTNVDVLNWIKTNWIVCLYGLAGYLAVGIAHMWLRWEIFSSKVDRAYGKIRDSFLLKSGDPKILETPNGRDELARTVRDDITMRDLNAQVPLLVRRNKARLGNWVAFWPISGAEYLLGDLLVDIVNGIVRTFSGMLQRMTDRKFKKYNELN